MRSLVGKKGRDRLFLTPSEMSILLAWVKKNSGFPARDYAMFLVAYRHGLRVSELLSLRWSDLNRDDRRIMISRLKNGKSSTHPLFEDEIKALESMRRRYKERGISATSYLFVNQFNGLQLSRWAFYSLCEKVNKENILPIRITPHTLRHSCGYYLANKGYDTRLIQDYLGHRNIANTEIYTQLASVRFNDIKW